MTRLDLTQYIRRGDHVAWPQGAGEPVTLVRQLIERRHELRDVTLFFGTLLGDSLTPDNCDGLALRAMGGLVKGSALTKAGVVDVLPVRVTAIPQLIDAGEIRVDVALIQVVGPDDRGRYSLAATADYVHTMIAAARIVIAEVNEQAPFTWGDTLVDAADIDVLVPVNYPLQSSESFEAGPGSEVAILSRNIAELIPDGATLQTGIGSMVDTLPAHLGDKNDLGIHSGVINDATLSLIEKGIVTNTAKEIDPGVTVTGALFGTHKLYSWADRNPHVALRGLDYTHSAVVLSQLGNFWAVNGAVEVDLFGQINSEMVAGRHMGAVGGQLDFANAAMASKRGRSVIGLTSTAASGRISRITVRSADGIASTPRADADIIVTEYGVADLRSATISERRERLIAIAHPDHRDSLREG